MVANLGIHKELRGAQDWHDAMAWKAVILADLRTPKSLVAGDKALEKCLSFIEDYRQASVDLAQAELRAQQHQRRGDPAAFEPSIAYAPWHSSAEPD